MVESRWLRWIGPGVMALGAVGLIASTTIGAGAVHPWTAGPCGGPPTARIAAAADPGGQDLASVRRAPWFRLDPRLDRGGALQGQRLTFGLDGDPVVRTLDLPPESFAAGPFGRLILAGADDGSVSRLRALDVGGDCSWSIAEEGSVVRRATIDPTGSGVFEMRVDRATRADLGIWFRPVAGSAPARQVLPPLAADDRFGRTFATEFTWDLAGDRLAVQSCGEIACRTRILTAAGAMTATVDAPDLGLIVGFDGERVVTYAACRGLPCPIVATDVTTRARRTLADDADLAVLVATANGPRLVREVRLPAGRRLVSVPLDGGPSADLGAIPDALRLAPSANRADAATRVPRGWIVLAPDGRLPLDGQAGSSQLRHVPDGATVTLDEASR